MKKYLVITGNDNGIKVTVSSESDYLFDFKADKYQTIGKNTYLFYIDGRCFMRLSNVMDAKIVTETEYTKIFRF